MSTLPLATNIQDAFDALATAMYGTSAEPFHSARKAAMDGFNERGIPTTRHEEWKYTNVMPIAAKTWRHVQNVWSDGTITDHVHPVPGLQNAIGIVLRNGIIHLTGSTIPDGVEIMPLSSASVEDVNESDLHDNPFAVAAMALSSEGVLVRVADNVQCPHTIHVMVCGETDDDGILLTTRVFVSAGRNAQVDVIETHHTLGGADLLSLGVCSAVVHEGARMSYVKIIDDASALHHIGQLTARVERSGTFASHSINLNAGFVRNDAQIKLAGELSQGFLYGTSILDGVQYVDNHTVVDHMVPHCHSEELYKGVYNGASAGVFNGKIFVRPQAQKTTAYQSSHSLLLSGKAQVNAKPQLEIWADDVKCSHGATTGQLNEDAVFYLQARGLERSQAAAMLTNAFAAEVLEKLPHGELKNHLLQRLADKLGAAGL